MSAPQHPAWCLFETGLGTHCRCGAASRTECRAPQPGAANEERVLTDERILQIRECALVDKVDVVLTQEWEVVALCDLSLEAYRLREELKVSAKRWKAAMEERDYYERRCHELHKLIPRSDAEH